MPGRTAKPFRPRAESFSQGYHDGLVRIYAVSDGAQPGYQPQEVLILRGVLPFETRRLGVTRMYQARQAQAEIERVVRVPKTPAFPILAQDRAIVVGHDAIYRIDSVQATTDVYPASVDLGLVRISQGTEVTP